MDDGWIEQARQEEERLLARITITPGMRGGKPCVRGIRVTVADILGWLAAGMTHDEILHDFPYLERDDIFAALTWAARGEARTRYLTPRAA